MHLVICSSVLSLHGPLLVSFVAFLITIIDLVCYVLYILLFVELKCCQMFGVGNMHVTGRSLNLLTAAAMYNQQSNMFITVL